MLNPLKTINRRVLLIDDEAPLHEAYHKILCPVSTSNTDFDDLESEMFGDTSTSQDSENSSEIVFEVTSAYQGEEGLKHCKQAIAEGRPFAMAFVDMRMPPGWDGLETITRLWEVDPKLQVVICSAYTDYSWDEVRAKLGYSNQLLILKKPFEKVEVHQMAAALTEKWSLGQAADLQMDQLEQAVSERTRDLRQTQKELVQAEKMASIGQLAAGVAHEINNPIGFIASNLDTLGHYVSDLTRVLHHYAALDKAVEACSTDIGAKREAAAALARDIDLDYLLEDSTNLVTESVAGTSRVQSIVSGLMDINQADDDAMKPEDFNALVTKTLSVVQNNMPSGVNIKTEFGTLPPVTCCANKISQAVMKLLVNAMQAVGDQGVIAIHTGADGPRVWVDIIDSGHGIPADVLDKIYDPFFTTKDVGGGTGLGLHLAYNNIQSHEGTIRVQSEVGKGTAFRIEIPTKINK